MNNEKGMTLLELLIAIAILSIVITPFYTQFVKSVELGERSERIVRAEYIAQKVLEEEKRLSRVPDSGNTREEVIDSFRVVVTYSDQSNEINTSNDSLEFFDDGNEHDFLIQPDISGSNMRLEFTTSGGASLPDLPAIDNGDAIRIILAEGSAVNEYEIKYSVDGGAETDVDSFIKADTTNVQLVFRTPEISDNNLSYDIILENQTDGDEERPLELREYDDVNRNFSFSTSNSSGGDVFLILKLNSDPEENIDNDLDYYWVNIEVIDGAGEVMAELHSSIRRE